MKTAFLALAILGFGISAQAATSYKVDRVSPAFVYAKTAGWATTLTPEQQEADARQHSRKMVTQESDISCDKGGKAVAVTDIGETVCEKLSSGIECNTPYSLICEIK